MTNTLTVNRSMRTMIRAPRGGYCDLPPTNVACADWGTWLRSIDHYRTMLSTNSWRRHVDAAAETARAMCHGCPLRHRCSEASRVEVYTGIAAGHAWRNGEIIA